jgi:hypothetical protein
MHGDRDSDGELRVSFKAGISGVRDSDDNDENI